MKANKNKATHYGTCQLCGSLQKLPGGVLSRHGYFLFHGTFEGTCPGSSWAPYEKSTDRIEAGLGYVAKTLGKIQARITTVSEITDPTQVYKQDFNQKGKPWIVATIKDMTQYKLMYSIPAVTSDAEVVRIANGKYINYLSAKVAAQEEYAKWLTKRKASWVETELPPVSEGA